MSNAEHTTLSSLGLAKEDDQTGWSMDIHTDNKLAAEVLCLNLDGESQTISKDTVIQGTSW